MVRTQVTGLGPVTSAWVGKRERRREQKISQVLTWMQVWLVGPFIWRQTRKKDRSWGVPDSQRERNTLFLPMSQETRSTERSCSAPEDPAGCLDYSTDTNEDLLCLGHSVVTSLEYPWDKKQDKSSKHKHKTKRQWQVKGEKCLALLTLNFSP